MYPPVVQARPKPGDAFFISRGILVDMDTLLLYSGWALVLFRVIVGAVLMAHGVPKIRNLDATAKWFHSVGFRPGRLWGSVAAILETFGGALLILGLLVRPLAFLFILQFLVIIVWKIMRKQSFTGNNGSELDLLLLGSMLILLTVGGGFYGF